MQSSERCFVQMLWETIRKKAVVVHPVSIRVSRAPRPCRKFVRSAAFLHAWQHFTPIQRAHVARFVHLACTASVPVVHGWPIQAHNTATWWRHCCWQMCDSCSVDM